MHGHLNVKILLSTTHLHVVLLFLFISLNAFLHFIDVPRKPSDFVFGRFQLLTIYVKDVPFKKKITYIPYAQHCEGRFEYKVATVHKHRAMKIYRDRQVNL